MTTITQAFNVFKVIFKDTFYKSINNLGVIKKKNKEDLVLNAKPKKKAGKVAVGVFIALGIAMMAFYMVMFAAMFTQAGVTSGVHEEVLYLFLALAQFIVVFFGSVVLLNYLYFSKDNELLATLPVPPRSIFMAKFAMAYVSELLICLFISLPTVTTYGIVAGSMGVPISWTFYLYTIISSFLLPIFPLLIASIISVPLMFIVSFLKKRTVGNAIVIGILVTAVVALYMALISGVSNMGQNVDEEGMSIFTPAIINMVLSVKKYTIFNYNLVNALLGNKSFVNFILYVLGLVVVFAVAVLVSAVFYNKGMRITLEGNGTKAKNKNYKTSYAGSSFTKSFVRKEVKNILHTPQLFANTFMGLIFIPLFAFIFGKSMQFSPDDATFGADLGMIGMVIYMSSIMIASTNTIALVGFSMEGKNLYLLKTLPVTAKDIIKPKLIVSNMIGFLMAFVAALSIIIISPFHNPIVALLALATLLLSSIGTTTLGLYNDLKNPNLNFKNVTELTKNNKRLIKPMLISLGIGFYYMVLGVIFSVIKDDIFPAIYKYLVFFGVGFLINGLFAYLNWKSLTTKAEERYDSIEV